jgi:hypothetical protein
MLTVEQLDKWSEEWSGYVSVMLQSAIACTVAGARWIHATTGAQLLAVKSDEPCDELPAKHNGDRIKSLRKWLGPIPVTSVAIKLDDLRAWHGDPTDSDQAMQRTSIGWIDGAPFNRYLVKHALSLIETPLVMAWWAEPGGPLMFADADNTWRVAVMPMTEDYFGKPWPTADRPHLVLRASWDRSKAS